LLEINEDSPARILISELMVLINKESAEFAEKKKIPLVFRSQEQADKSARSALANIEQGAALDFAVRGTLKRSIMSTRPLPHATLALPSYAQVSSPIRRYTDLLNQRQLLSVLTKDKLYYTDEQLTLLLQELENPLGLANAVSKETKRFWMQRYLQDSIKADPFLDGTVVRIDLKLPIVELDKVYITAMIKTNDKLKLGERIRAKITAVDPRTDYLRLEMVEKLGA
jgi:exoribonuclease-2